MCIVDQLEKGFPKECFKGIFRHPLAIYRIREAIHGHEDIFFVNCKRSVLFWLNFLLAVILKDRLEFLDFKNISLASFTRKKNKLV